MLKKPIVLHYDKKIKKIKIFCSIFAPQEKKNGRKPFVKKFGAESPPREKPKSGVLEKNINF